MEAKNNPSAKSAGVFAEVIHQRTDLNTLGHLGDPAFVGGLLKELTGKFVARAQQYLQRQMSFEDLDRADNEDCNRLAWALMGQSALYTPVGAWNTDGGLAQAFREALDLPAEAQEDDQIAILYGLKAFRDRVYEILEAGLLDEIPDEEVKRQIEALLHSYALFIAGVPTDLADVVSPSR